MTPWYKAVLNMVCSGQGKQNQWRWSDNFFNLIRQTGCCEFLMIVAFYFIFTFSSQSDQNTTHTDNILHHQPDVEEVTHGSSQIQPENHTKDWQDVMIPKSWIGLVSKEENLSEPFSWPNFSKKIKLNVVYQ